MKVLILALVALTPLVSFADMKENKKEAPEQRAARHAKAEAEAKAELDGNGPETVFLSPEQIDALQKHKEKAKKKAEGLRVTDKFDKLTNGRLKSSQQFGEIMVYRRMCTDNPGKDSLHRSIAKVFGKKYDMTEQQWLDFVKTPEKELFYIDETGSSENGKLKTKKD